MSACAARSPWLCSGSGCCGEVVGWRHIPGEGGREGEVNEQSVIVNVCRYQEGGTWLSTCGTYLLEGMTLL